MDLRTYLESAERGTGSKLAGVLGVNRVLISQWAAPGGRAVPVEHCAALELATGGAVSRRQLRPDDWHRIWPELVTSEFPAPEAKAAA